MGTRGKDKKKLRLVYSFSTAAIANYPDLVVKPPVFTFSLLRLETRSKGVIGVGLSQAAENPP